jgi:hypothetical protein
MSQHWAPKAVALLRQLWPDHSASVIAGRLSASGLVVTRNAVIGKAHRLGLIKGPANIAQSENVGNRSNGATLKPGRWRRAQ